jgi:hypothetical protein
VNQNVGKFKENLKLQNAIASKLIVIGRKYFIFITYLSHSVGIQSFIEIQGRNVSSCVDFTWNDPIVLLTTRFVDVAKFTTLNLLS